jgi:hypothetical protein
MRQQKMHPATAQRDAGQIPLRSSDQSGFPVGFRKHSEFGPPTLSLLHNKSYINSKNSALVKFRGSESKIISAMLLIAQMLIRSQRRIYNMPIQGSDSILHPAAGS